MGVYEECIGEPMCSHHTLAEDCKQNKRQEASRNYKPIISELLLTLVRFPEIRLCVILQEQRTRMHAAPTRAVTSIWHLPQISF